MKKADLLVSKFAKAVDMHGFYCMNRICFFFFFQKKRTINLFWHQDETKKGKKKGAKGFLCDLPVLIEKSFAIVYLKHLINKMG